MATDSPEIAQDLVTRLVTTLRKYNMKIAPTKTVWMHIGGGEVPEALTVESERIVRVQGVTYLGSVLDANGEGPLKCSTFKCPACQATNHKDQTLTKKFRGSQKT